MLVRLPFAGDPVLSSSSIFYRHSALPVVRGDENSLDSKLLENCVFYGDVAPRKGDSVKSRLVCPLSEFENSGSDAPSGGRQCHDCLRFSSRLIFFLIAQNPEMVFAGQ